MSDSASVSARPFCVRAFSVLCASLSPSLPCASRGALPAVEGGVFVTWTTSRGRDGGGSLRGCIGTLSSTRVDAAVEQYALHAAFRDPRFDPIRVDELPMLRVAVSVLSGFEHAAGLYDWDVGVHGIVLDVQHGRYSATYLPEVCAEQGWSKTQCLQHLKEKAGWNGTLADASVRRYTSHKAELTYQEYVQLVQLAPAEQMPSAED